ncbi:ROK family protein [Arthrobacter sp. 35W]|uniref:ROK family protein n=1 Tax=Arthrobacter sp. 35W TaxID=1132441 RepID=UPI00042A236A|nr:ROK family protein [Arthrobacter sp. 35W]
MVSTPATPASLRRANAAAVLAAVRAGTVVTGTELMAGTGLTRATVMAVCDELAAAGWILELDGPRDGAAKGRPARCFELNADAGAVLGLDVGAGKTTAVVLDLRGTVLGRAVLPSPGLELDAAGRVELASNAALAALAQAGIGADRILAAAAGVPAPIDKHGRIRAGQPFWALFDVDLREALRARHGWEVLVENDANLAALAERWSGAAQGVEDLAVLLAGERLGAGLMDSGRLLHGHGGSAGEMDFLKLVAGVGSTHGIAYLAREWGQAAVDEGRAPGLAALAAGGPVSAELVFAAAHDGDPVAVALLERLAERMARVIAALGSLANPELVVLAGAVAASAGALLEGIDARLPALTVAPPRVAASPLGTDVVALGAARHALDYVESHAPELELA